MRVFVTSNFSKSADKTAINELHQIVKDSGGEVFNFVLDYPIFDDYHQMMAAATAEIAKSDVLLIDVSDTAVGRLIESGIAYAMGKKVVAIQHVDTKEEKAIIGIADLVVKYANINDIQVPLTNFLLSIQNK